MKSTANSQAQLQFAQSNTRPKIAIELVCNHRFFANPKTIFSGNDSALIESLKL